MEKNAFKMKLKPGFKEEYKRRHDAVWPEILTILRKDGISDYTIFLDEDTDILFAVHKHPAHQPGEDKVAHPVTDIIRKWWDYMADIMETNPDNSPVMKPLEKMFHMD